VRTLLLLCLFLSACTPGLQGDPDIGPTDGDDDDVTDDDDAVFTGTCDGVGGTSTLAGACIRMDAQDGPTSLDAAASGIQIPYTIIIEQDIADVVPLPQDAGGCGTPGDSGLIVFERLQGGQQVYCVCDEGLCAGPDRTPRTLAAGATPTAFAWSGRNWTGPSDTGFPLGDPFPVGIYTLTVSASGQVGGENFVVANTFQVTLDD
jgi:hypothetical protein